MTRQEALAFKRSIKRSTVRPFLAERGGRMAWFVYLCGALAPFDETSMLSHGTQEEAREAGEFRKAYCLELLSMVEVTR